MGSQTTTWSEFPNGGKAILEQLLESEQKTIKKEQDHESCSQGTE